MQEIIKVEDLCKTYDSGVVQVNALKHINITIEQANSSPSWAILVQANPH